MIQVSDFRFRYSSFNLSFFIFGCISGNIQAIQIQNTSLILNYFCNIMCININLYILWHSAYYQITVKELTQGFMC